MLDTKHTLSESMSDSATSGRYVSRRVQTRSNPRTARVVKLTVAGVVYPTMSDRWRCTIGKMSWIRSRFRRHSLMSSSSDASAISRSRGASGPPSRGPAAVITARTSSWSASCPRNLLSSNSASRRQPATQLHSGRSSCWKLALSISNTAHRSAHIKRAKMQIRTDSSCINVYIVLAHTTHFNKNQLRTCSLCLNIERTYIWYALSL